MKNRLSFTDIQKFIGKKHTDLLDVLDPLIGAAIIFSPLLFGPAALPFLSLLSVKNELIKAGKSLIDGITANIEKDYISKMHRMEIAFTLICYTAFFDAVDNTIPLKIRKQLKKANEETLKEMSHHLKEDIDINAHSLDNLAIHFPHPTESFSSITKSLSNKYDTMAVSFGRFLDEVLLCSMIDEEREKFNIEELVDSLKKEAITHFEAQYYHLATINENFWIWAQIKDAQNSKQTQSKYIEEYMNNMKNHLDIGFSGLHDIVTQIPDMFNKVEAQSIVDGLSRCYKAKIEKPVIEEDIPEPEKSKEDICKLTFPKISDAYIPQSYKSILYENKETHLEQERTWDSIKEKNDLANFFVRYLSSPYSIETPLLVLGEPGSGKSLLTKILAAQLMCTSYTTIRIPLREIDADVNLTTLIEKQIEKDTSGSTIRSWADFSNQFSDRPLVIILDGFDELLQVTGRVYSSFIKEAYNFQQEHIVQNRPIRIIITSRITLIDKATIPIDTTVLRLLKFNKRQRQAWIDIWNKSNKTYFSTHNQTVNTFKLPDEKKNPKIIELAEQPLLLLMLAIYDSVDNALHKDGQLNRTVLYYRLLRRFIIRERFRNKTDFESISQDETQQIVDCEMKRLGVAAIGMYNRKRLFIHSSELSNDIRFFEVERNLEVTEGKRLSETDLLVGSFFFVHKSCITETNEETSNTVFSFEFLHNTFGEFLTADFIINIAINETLTLYSLLQNKNLAAKASEQLNNPNQISKEWYSCLMFAPIFSRPVILQMIREWYVEKLKMNQFPVNDFIENFEKIIESHITMTLNTKCFPDIMLSDDTKHFGDIPLTGLIATYTANLISIRAVLNNKYIFDENQYSLSYGIDGNNKMGVRPWDRLTQIWRSWFSLDELNSFSNIATSKRTKNQILISGLKDFRSSSTNTKLNLLVNIGDALSDYPLYYLAILHTKRGDNIYNDEIYAKLENEKIDISSVLFLRDSRKKILKSDNLVFDFNDVIFKEKSLMKIINTSTVNYSIELIHLLIISAKYGKLSPDFTEFLIIELFNIFVENNIDNSLIKELLYLLIILSKNYNSFNDARRILITIFNDRHIRKIILEDLSVGVEYVETLFYIGNDTPLMSMDTRRRRDIDIFLSQKYISHDSYKQRSHFVDFDYDNDYERRYDNNYTQKRRNYFFSGEFNSLKYEIDKNIIYVVEKLLFLIDDNYRKSIPNIHWIDRLGKLVVQLFNMENDNIKHILNLSILRPLFRQNVSTSTKIAIIGHFYYEEYHASNAGLIDDILRYHNFSILFFNNSKLLLRILPMLLSPNYKELLVDSAGEVYGHLKNNNIPLDIDNVIILIKLALYFDNEGAHIESNSLIEIIVQNFRINVFSNISISYIKDLFWFADKVGNSELKENLLKYLP